MYVYICTPIYYSSNISTFFQKVQDLKNVLSNLFQPEMLLMSTLNGEQVVHTCTAARLSISTTCGGTSFAQALFERKMKMPCLSHRLRNDADAILQLMRELNVEIMAEEREEGRMTESEAGEGAEKDYQLSVQESLTEEGEVSAEVVKEAFADLMSSYEEVEGRVEIIVNEAYEEGEGRVEIIVNEASSMSSYEEGERGQEPERECGPARKKRKTGPGL
jgi:hypothetical protein